MINFWEEETYKLFDSSFLREVTDGDILNKYEKFVRKSAVNGSLYVMEVKRNEYYFLLCLIRCL